MNFVFHHVRKDLRHSRWLIAATWLVAAGILWLSFTPVEERSSLIQWLPFFRYGSWLLLFLTVGRIVQLDAPLRDTAFLRSRPVSQTTWLASKLTTCTILIVPMALFDVLSIPLTGLRPGSLDLLLIFAEEFLAHGLVAVFALTLSARVGTFSRFIAVAMGISFSALVIFMIYVNAADWWNCETKPVWSYDNEYLKLSRLLIAQFIAATLLTIGLHLSFRGNRPERLGTALAVATIAAALAWLFWPLNFVKTLTRSEAEAPRAERPDLSKVDFSFVTNRFNGEENQRFNWGFGGYNDVHYQHVSAFTRMEGLPPEWWAYPNGYRSTLASPSGVVARSSQSAWAGLAEEIILPSVGIALPWERTTRNGEVEIGDFLTTKVEAAGEDAVLEGEILLPIKRPVVLARIPLKAGASALIGNRRITITKVELPQDDRVFYQTVEERPLCKLRGGRHGEAHRRIQTIAVNTRRREFLKQQSGGSSNLSTGHYAVLAEHHEDRLGGRDTRWDTPIPSDWLDDAELLITGDESGGTFTREFRFENVNLIDSSWRP